MKAIVESNRLRHFLKRIGSLCQDDDTRVVIEAAPDSIWITAGDSVQASQYLDGKVINTGTAVMSARSLRKLGRKLEREPVEISASGSSIDIRQENLSYEFPEKSATGFERYKNGNALGSADGKTLKRIFRNSCIYNAFYSNTRFVHLVGDGDKLTATSTDGHNWLELSMSFAGTMDCLVDHENLEVFARLIPDGDILVHLDDGRLSVRQCGYCVSVPATEGNWYSKKQITDRYVPDPVIVDINRKALLKALQRAICTSFSSSVKFAVHQMEDAVKLSNDLFQEKISCRANGSIRIGIHDMHTIKILQELRSEEIRMEIHGATKPIIIREPGAEYIGMPTSI